MLVAVAILTYSSLVYFAEKEGLETFGDVNCSLFINSTASKFPGHPCYSWTFLEAFWWGLMTITTVGYDLNPRLLTDCFKLLDCYKIVMFSEAFLASLLRDFVLYLEFSS